MTRSGARGVRRFEQQDRQQQGMSKCMNAYTAPLKKNQYTKLMSQLRSSTKTSTATATQPDFSNTTFLTSSKPPKTMNPSKFAGIGGPPPNRLVFHALPSSSKSSSSKEKMSIAVKTKKIGSNTVTTPLNHRFVTWRVEDHNRGKGLNYSGVSATELAGRLSGDFWDDHIDDEDVYEEEQEQEQEDDLGLENHDVGLDDTEVFPGLPVRSLNVGQVEIFDSKIKDVVDSGDKRIEIEDEDGNQDQDDDFDLTSFCVVEFAIDQLDDDGDEVGWCLVGDY